jgi:flagellar hook-length control protein FliK
MSNGQMSIDSMPTVMPMVAQEPAASVTTALDGMPQAGGNFAGVLHGMQHVAKGKELPDTGQTEQLSSKIGTHQSHRNAGAEEPAVDVLAQLQVLPGITPASGPATPKQEESEKDAGTDAVLTGSEPSDVASQIAMAAYLQTGRMPEVNIPAQLPVDRLQQLATAAEQPAVTVAQAVVKQVEHVTSETLSATELQRREHVLSQQSAVETTVAANAVQPAQSDRRSDVSILTTLPADTLQKVATITELSAVSAASSSAPTSASQPAKSDRMSDSENLKGLPNNRLPHSAAVAGQSVLFSALPDEIRVSKPIAEPVQAIPVQTPVTRSAITAPDEHIVLQGTGTADMPAIPAEKPAAASVTLHSELPSDHPATASSPESELEISLSQSRPITAQVTAAPVAANNRSAALVQETHGARQQITPDQQGDKVRKGTEQSDVKEADSVLQTAASAGKSMSGSETSNGGDSTQGQQNSTSDNQALAQQMRGQLSMEHQKIAASSTKGGATEPVRQDIPEQVMQQVKERLVQHDVKPGNQQITLTLSPDSLGELKMNLNLQGQKLSVEIITENRTVRDAIMLHTDALKESLARQNITMESFDVTTGGKGSGNQGQNQNAWRELAKQQNQQQLWTSSRGYHTAQADLPSGQVFQRQQGQTMLDIHY